MSLLTSDVKDVVEQYKQKYGKEPTINEVTDALRGRFREDIDPAWVRDQLERISDYDSMKGKMKKLIITTGVASVGCMVFGDTLVISDSPTIVQKAAIREAIRQDSTWTSENIQKNPYLFLQDQITACDRLKARIEAQNITLIRMEKKATRAVKESEGMRDRYEKFLSDAKAAYKAANGKWPVSVNGYDLDEDELNDKIADAMERVELAKKEHKDNAAIAKKVSIRKGILKTKKRELVSLRMKLVQQAEQVKMNAALAELGDLKAALGTIQDMMIEIDEDPTKLSVEDLTAEDPNAKRNKKVSSFLNN